jgi:hypothetical protein
MSNTIRGRNKPKEAPLFKTNVALAIWLCLALMTAPASAQGGPSYEGRGYGGPLYVGPNFHEGGQYSAPVYGSRSYGSPSSREDNGATTRQRHITRSSPAKEEATAHKGAPDDKPSETKAPATKAAETENSSIAVVRMDTTEGVVKPKDDKPVETNAATKTAGTDNSSIAVLSTRTDTAEVAVTSKTEAKPMVEATDTPVNCKKYFPAVGLTLSVPCDPK